MAAGRPTKYKPEYCEQVIEFFSVPHTVVVVDKVIQKNGSVIDCPRIVPNDLPTFQRFAHSIGVCKDTIYEWAKVHSDFSDSLKRAKELQEDMWLSNSLKGYYPNTFTIFAGKNMFGWRDKKETEFSGSVTMNAADALIKALGGKNEGKG
jgi:hypothetical protein